MDNGSVFISYARHQTTTEFVEELTRLLRDANYRPWLDTEQVPPGAEPWPYIRARINQADSAVFVVSSDWLAPERYWPEYELQQFATEFTRNFIAIRLGGIDHKDLPPELHQKKSIEWSKEQIHDRSILWQIHCGLQNQQPGPRPQWARKGQELLGESPEAICLETFTPARSAPIDYFSTSRGCYFSTELEEWVEVLDVGNSRSLPTGPRYVSCAYSCAKDSVVLGSYLGLLYRLRSNTWEEIWHDGPILCLAKHDKELIVGTSSGRITAAFEPLADRYIRLHEPVVHMISTGDGVIAIGSHGHIARFETLKDSAAKISAIDASGLEGVLGHFPALEAGRLGLFDQTRLAILDPNSNRLRLGKICLDEPIRDVLYAGPGPYPFVVISDLGATWQVNATLSEVRTCPELQEQKVAGGCTLSFAQGVALWTKSGGLGVLNARREFKQILDEKVVFGCATSSHPGSLIVIRNQDSRATVEVVPLTGDV